MIGLKASNELLDQVHSVEEVFGFHDYPLTWPVSVVTALSDIVVIDDALCVCEQVALLECAGQQTEFLIL